MWKHRETYGETILKSKYLTFVVLCLVGFSEVSWAGCFGTYCDINHNVYSSASACAAACSSTPYVPPPTPYVPPPPSYQLTVKSSGTGTGTLGGTSAGTYTSGTSVTLTATAVADSDFKGWSPTSCGSTFSLTSNTECVAQFDLKTPTLTLQTTGTGTGKITGTAAGTYTIGQAVQLTATADTGSDFKGWTPTSCGSAFNLNGAVTCTAQFDAKVTLSVNKTGTGSGTLGGTAAGTYSSGQSVSLTATADANSDFKGWTPTSCATAFPLTANTSCTAQFEAKPISSVIIDPNPCVRGSELNAACNGAGDKTTVTTIGPSGQLSNTIISHKITSQGWVSNATIAPKGKLDGGTTSGFIDNRGIVCNTNFRGGVFQGGILCGNNKNTSEVNGVFRNVTFAPCATLTGGKIGGNIKADPNCPAKLNNVKVEDNSTLSDVELDTTSSKGKNVTTKTNPKLPELGKGTATDSLGNSTTSSDFYGGISVNVADSSSTLNTKVSDNYTPYNPKTTQKLIQPSRLRGRITANPEDVGKIVDFVIYSPFWDNCPDVKKDVNKDEKPPYFMADGESKISYWDQKPENLKAFKTGVVLDTIQDVDMFDGFFITHGCLNIVFGYRLPNGTIVTNIVPNTIDVEIK